MDLTPYVETLRNELSIAAAAGGDEAVALAERLTAPLDSATRLVIQEALSDAAQEITRELVPGSVDLRIRGRELAFVVTPPPATQAISAAPAPAEPAAEAAGEEGTSRISFRPPDSLKARIEAAAEREGLSVNSFLVRTLQAALDPSVSSPNTGRGKGGDRVSGWFR